MKPWQIVLIVVPLFTYPACASDRFAPGNPTFAQFEASCRNGADLALDCRGSVVGAYAEHAKVAQKDVTCDFKDFWRVKDAKYGGKITAVLPWQYAIEFIVAEPGVCK